jgi:PKD repeat protein
MVVMKKARRGQMREKKTSKFFLMKHTVVLIVLLGVFSGMSLVRAADPTPVNVTPASQTVTAGDSFVVTIRCVPQQPVKAFELKVSFNPSLLLITSVSEGDIFEGYTTFFSPGIIDNTAGTLVNVYNLIVGPGNVTAEGSLVTINFTARSTNGDSPVSLYDVRLTNETGYIPITVSSGSVTITGGSNPPPPPEPPENPPGSENTPPLPPQQPVGPSLAQVGATYLYSSAAVDPDGDQVRLRFDWGDGTLSNWSDYVASNTSVSMVHAWQNASTYAVRVIAQDTLGANSSWSEPLTVIISQNITDGVPPVAVFPLPVNATVNRPVVFDASESYDPDGTIISYHWDFGDGGTGADAILIHMYQASGDYTVTLTVTDNTGMTTSTSQVLPVAVAQGSTGENGLGFFTSLPPEHLILFLAAIVGSVLCVLLYYRYRPSEKSLSKQMKLSKRTPDGLGSRKAPSSPHLEQHNLRMPASVTTAHASRPDQPMQPKTVSGSVDTEIAALQKRIEQQKVKRTVRAPPQATADIDQIISEIFHEMQHRGQTPRTDTVLQAYNKLIVEQVEKNPSLPLPMVDIETVKEVVKRRVHALIAEKLDRM